MVIMQRIGGYVNAVVIDLLHMHYNDILSILNKLDSFVHKHWPFRGDVPQQRRRGPQLLHA